MDIKALDKSYVANTYDRFDLVAEKGEGAVIWDQEGKRYIDFGAGIGVNSFGACDKIWMDAVTGQLKKLQHLSNLYYTAPQAELAALLCERTGMDKVFFSNSGAEANECGIKFARKYSFDKYGSGRHRIVSLVNSFHGRTLASLSATGQEALQAGFEPMLPGFSYVSVSDGWTSMKKALDGGDVCAVMLELVQGEGGVIPLDKEYVQKIAKEAAERDILLFIDEVQTGNGRTGSLYSYMQYAIEPDIVSTAKGLGGGLPIGATLFGKKASASLGFGTHGSTYGGNPVCSAGAISVIKRLDQEFLESVRLKGEHIKKALLSSPGVKEIKGLGLMLGITLADGYEAKTVVSRCMERGLILLTAKEKIRLLPPLNISMDELDEGIEILKEVLK